MVPLDGNGATVAKLAAKYGDEAAMDAAGAAPDEK
jgi:hypothetical protein